MEVVTNPLYQAKLICHDQNEAILLLQGVGIFEATPPDICGNYPSPRVVRHRSLRASSDGLAPKCPAAAIRSYLKYLAMIGYLQGQTTCQPGMFSGLFR